MGVVTKYNLRYSYNCILLYVITLQFNTSTTKYINKNSQITHVCTNAIYEFIKIHYNLFFNF